MYGTRGEDTGQRRLGRRLRRRGHGHRPHSRAVPDRVAVAELDTNRPVSEDVDIVLYDSFAQPESDNDEIRVLIENPHARRVAVYTWNFHPDLIDSARRKGASGYLSKTLAGTRSGHCPESIHAGATVISDAPFRARSGGGLDWPGRSEGLTDRESEILALITQGKSNAEVATLTTSARIP